MRRSGCVGRVGGLAVALGIGAAALTGGAAAASAAPSDEASSKSESAAEAPAATGQRGAPRTRGSASPTGVEPSRSGRGNDKLRPAAVTRPPKPAPDVKQPAEPVTAATVNVGQFELPASIQAPAEVTPAGPAPLPAPQFRVAVPMVTAPSPPPVPHTGGFLAPASAVGTVQSTRSPFSASWPGSPAESAVGWAVFSAVRRMGRPDPVPPPSATLSTGQTFTPAATRSDPISALLFNKTPTLSSAQTEQSATGVITGQITVDDADGDAVTYAVVANPKYGTVQVDRDGRFVYTPQKAAAHTGVTDQFSVTVSDDAGGFHVHGLDGMLHLMTFGLLGKSGHTETRTVTVTVAPVNAAPTATASIEGPDAGTGVVTGRVTATDADGDSLTYSAPAVTAKGAVAVSADGGLVYTPTAAARHGAAALTATATDKSDSFTVTVTDGYGGVTAVPVTVTIAPANAAPIASAAVGDPDPGTGLVSASVSGSDADGDQLSYTAPATPPAKGTVVVSANGTVVYTPSATARHAAAKLTAAAADKADTFAVTVTDGHGGAVSVPITVAIAPANAAPTGTPEVGLPDASTGVVAGAVLGVDADADVLGYSGSGETARGSVVVSADGRFAYTPTALARHLAALPDATVADAADSFVVTVVDGYGGSVEVPVTVAVSPASLNFNFVYSTGSQYWTPDARAALELAANRLESAIVTGRPVTVVIEVVGEDNPESDRLGTAFVKYSSSSPGYYGTVVQTLVLTGRDANGAATDSRIGVNFAYPWALGDAVAANQYDLQSVATHELVHTLGFMSGLGDPAAIDRNWTTFDRYLATAEGTAVIGADYVWDAAYTPNLTGGGGGLFFAGPNAVAAYGGPVPLYTPGVWRPGSSVIHLDPAAAPPGTVYLMDPTDGYGPGVRRLAPVEAAILTDLGYTVYQSPVYAVLVIGFGLQRRRRAA